MLLPLRLKRMPFLPDGIMMLLLHLARLLRTSGLRLMAWGSAFVETLVRLRDGCYCSFL